LPIPEAILADHRSLCFRNGAEIPTASNSSPPCFYTQHALGHSALYLYFVLSLSDYDEPLLQTSFDLNKDWVWRKKRKEMIAWNQSTH